MSGQNTPRPGRFVTFEGIDGAGKSSQIAAASQWVQQAGWELVCSREPGGTPLGEKLRALLLHEPMHLETEALLMFAARREHLAQVIEPALARGAFVLCDRFSDATYAYQHGGRGLDARKFATLEHWVHPGRQPDLPFSLTCPPKSPPHGWPAAGPTQTSSSASNGISSSACGGHIWIAPTRLAGAS